jgi:hypothetical protein
MDPMVIIPLAARPHAGPQMAARFKAEWPDFFAATSVDEIEREYFPADLDGRDLPMVLVAEVDGEVCGTVAIRDKGTREMTAEAWKRGLPELFAATNTAHRLFRRLGWEELGDFPYHGVTVAVFRMRPGG